MSEFSEMITASHWFVVRFPSVCEVGFVSKNVSQRSALDAITVVFFSVCVGGGHPKMLGQVR